MTYTLPPRSQKMVPRRRAIMVVKKNLTVLYGGLLQYDRFIFHRQAMHCVMDERGYLVGKYRSLEPGAGWLNSFIKALFLL